MLTSPFPPSGGGWVAAHQVFGSALTTPGRARAFVRCQLGRWGLADLVDTAELLVSELVTNAVRATNAMPTPPIASATFPEPLRVVALRLRLSPGSHSLFIEVWDASDQTPVPTESTDMTEGGRGLALVEALARTWGHHPAPDHGKIVWCELAVPRRDLPSRTRRTPCPRRSAGPDRATLVEILTGLRDI